MSNNASTNKEGNRSVTVPNTPLTSTAPKLDESKATNEVDNQATEMDEAEKRKQEKKERMRQKSEKAATSLIDPMKRMELFDSTKASGMETKGTSSLGSVKMDKDSAMIMGRNVGAEQNEPDWTAEQMAYINTMTSTVLDVQGVTSTRRSVPDALMEFVGRDETGSIAATEKAHVSNLDPSTYCIGVGQPKYDITGSPKHYVDAVIVDKKGEWLLTQWTSEWVVLEGVAPEVLMKQNKVGASLQSNRRIGVHFARIGLPKMAFGPLFNTLSANYPGIMSGIVETRGYYWMNASWGVSSFSATFAYVDKDGFKKTTNLSDVMRMLGGKSSLCLGTVAISITCGSKTEGNKQVMDTSSFALSVKLHNVFNVDTVDYHGPPQQGSTGMMIPSKYIKSAKIMSNSNVAGSGMSIFSSTKPGLFGTTSQPPASVTSDSNTSYM